MNVFVINGSPKGKKSNTFKLTQAFIEGMSAISMQNIDLFHVKRANIEHCKGCFSCWNNAHGSCVIKDDMSSVLQRYINSDCIIWSFPLYYFGMPSKIKAFMDRLLPIHLPEITIGEDGSARHPSRYDLSFQKHVLVSTCGFPSTSNNYEALCKQFDLAFGKKLLKILCPEGELFGIPQLAARADEYLGHVEIAGREYAQHGVLSEQTQKNIDTLLFPPEAFITMANAHWSSQGAVQASGALEQNSEAYRFLQQMASVYKPHDHQKDIVVEMYFTDIEQTYQLVLGKERCELLHNDFRPHTARIETPFMLWRDISAGKANGPETLMNKQYKVLGDFSVMLKFGEYFPTKKTAEYLDANKHTTLWILLLPWLVFWTLLPIDTHWTGFFGVMSCSLIPLLGLRYKLTLYDGLSSLLVAILSLVTPLSGETAQLLCLSYFLFGSMWLLSASAAIPLTAHYSCNQYGGKAAFANPLFIKTNRILSAAWGVLYLLLAAYSYLIIGSVLAQYTWLTNLAAPSLMGVFTLWFSRWYPAKVARGEI